MMRATLMTLLAWLVALTAAAAESGNQLANHPSPYLALHANDPVHWQDWGPGVLERAQREQKLILVSVGYFACHWCHVMQRESFANAEIAARLNRDFISVKVDRELEPVLDQRLMEFSQNINGIAGWPLNVFLTPEGYPLSGVVYLPPDEFAAYIDRLATRWNAQREQLGPAARELAARQAAVQRELESTDGQPAVSALADAFVAAALKSGDKLQGGFGQQSKFPTVPRLLGLLELHQQSSRPEVAAFLTLTLEHMADFGLFDHVGGGFFRYTTDPDWHTPHFEKMLYDNALLAWLYLRAAEVLKAPRWRTVGLATLRFMLRELPGGDGALIASLSAVDDKNIEGGFYLWRQEEIAKGLTADEQRFANAAWGLDRPTQWEAGALPMRVRTPQQLQKQL
ncbi:MAG: thioredoxin domain-containing protein, partial [Thiotrichales bacterium]